MKDWVFNVENISTLCATSKELSHVLSPYLAKEIWSAKDRKKLLDAIAEIFLCCPYDKNVIDFAHCLGPLMRDILHRCWKKHVDDDVEILSNFGVLLGEIFRVNFPNFLRLVSMKYFLENCFSANNDDFETCSSKKPRLNTKIPINVTLASIAQIVRTSARSTLIKWPWKKFFQKVDEARSQLNLSGVFATTEILSVILQLPRTTMTEIRSNLLPCQDASMSDEFHNCARQFNSRSAVSEKRVTVSEGRISYTKRAITSEDFSENVAVVAGLAVNSPIRKTSQHTGLSDDIVITDSLRCCLHFLALAAANGHPMMISGPPGCGKTSLIRHFAKNLLHKKLIEVQLGDGVDSKVLSGVYKCTAVSGEFEWQPGVLAQAVSNSDWILLEDIEKAPLDVVSLLLPLLENKTIKFPGRSMADDNMSGFRIFMTCRTSSDTCTANLHLKKLKRHSRFIELDALSHSDLKAIIESRFPKLNTMCEKVLEIYEDQKSVQCEKSRFDSKTCKRLPSVRDLLRLCSRMSMLIGKSGSDLSHAVAVEAADCLVAATISPEQYVHKIHSIFSLLNLSTGNAEYFCQSYHPQITFRNTQANFGRVCLHIANETLVRDGYMTRLFALTRSSSILLERIACAVKMNEPILLVGETGVGKTTGIQFMADKTGHELHIVNISQQSSSSDLLGAFKPIQRKQLIAPIRNKFEKLFVQTFSKLQNEKFLRHIQTCFLNKRFNDLLQLMMSGTDQALKKLLDEKLQRLWQDLSDDIVNLKSQMKVQESVAFAYEEGVLSQALRNGDWLLLDEINLASPETLDCLSSVLESDKGSVLLLEIGDTKPIIRHPDFRIFAAMNPATDVGKRNLPNNIRDRFLEVFVPEPTDDVDLLAIIWQYLKGRAISDKSIINGVLKFYRQISQPSTFALSPGGTVRPRYSLRSLCRALRFVTDNPKMHLIQALYEGLSLAFMTEVDQTRHKEIAKLILRYVVGNDTKSVLKGAIPKPFYKHVTVEGYHIRCGNEEPRNDEGYIMTPHIEKNLKILARAVSYGKYPVLIQGETSTGKTSMISYLASLTGNTIFRINNHEHTDLQEYIGSYSSGANGQFFFQEGPLVTAMREGHWIILDELNLAPTDILESLNRVLDDNRELFIPETQERVVAHPRFALFATQNPPGVYGGRKVLSRALRNRFIELHFGRIPSDEIKTILHRRCHLPMSRCKKLISVMEDLQERRSTSGIFAGKHSYITLRDLFRWAERYRRSNELSDSLRNYDWDQLLANDGYMLLAGRVRTSNEEVVIQETIQKHLGRKIDPNKIFGEEAIKKILNGPVPKDFRHIVFTSPLRKLLVMLHRALVFDEPVLLIGETGCGKTTACQLVSCLDAKSNSLLNVINCHSHTDASDFLGGLRPVRNNKHSNNTNDDNRLFEWVDGPLVKAMIHGNGILVDEISLAEDSVLERFNSVLEPSRKLVIPDRVFSDESTSDLTIQAQTGFKFMATMNPGGDFGKKELSPALRNRLTEIWCTAVNENLEEVAEIVRHNLAVPDNFVSPFSDIIASFIKWFKCTNFGSKAPRSIRDVMKWVQFCNMSYEKGMDPVLGVLHGALLVFVDGIGSGASGNVANRSKEARVGCVSYILKSLKESELDKETLSSAEKFLGGVVTGFHDIQLSVDDGILNMGAFNIPLGQKKLNTPLSYSFNAPTTSMNVFRLLRALQSPSPILLEGSPGIGKTSLVVALARISGYDIVRINLSEETDISDLLGADLPVEDGTGGSFCWRDGPLLAALKRGAWVVFDELNLASQSVLEGLNSVFDHRGEIFVPELGVTFRIECDKTRIFACQNPYYQGGGRKGLPKSFLNRFNQVFMEPLSESDMVTILCSQFSTMPSDIVTKMVHFNEEVRFQVVEKHLWGNAGSPWEFNLRDLARWCELVVTTNNNEFCPEACMYLIYCERLQNSYDRKKMNSLFLSVFGTMPYNPSCDFHLSSSYLKVGNAMMQRERVFPVPSCDTLLIPSMLHSMESLMSVLSQGWMAILTGASGCGKTTLVKTLAALAGKRLQTFTINSSMDATELLGGFEQLDFIRHLSSVLDGFSEEIMSHCQSQGKLLDADCILQTTEVLGSLKDINDMKARISRCTDVKSAIKCGGNLKSLLKSFSLKCYSQKLSTSLLTIVQRYEATLDTVLKRIEQSRGKFEWVDSELVEALKAGDWLLIEGANLCNPSVLDRLNALLEPGGTLTITERGIIDGSFVDVNPDPSFRLILSLDTSEGNLSRAMRNRGVEIHMLSPENCDGAQNSIGPESISWNEMKRIVEGTLSYCPLSLKNQIRSYLFKFFNSNISSVNPQTLMFKCLQCAQEIAEAIAAGDDEQSLLMRISSKYCVGEVPSKVVDNPESSCTRKVMPLVRLNNIIHDSNAAMVFYEGQFFNQILESACLEGKQYLLHEAVCYFLQLSSQNDWKFRMKYLSDFVISDSSVFEIFQEGMEFVIASTPFQRFVKLDEEYKNISWDLRMRLQLLNAVRNMPYDRSFVCTNACTVLFVTKLHHLDIENHLHAQASLRYSQKASERKKSRSRQKFQRYDDTLGPLVLSYLYHTHAIKAQNLPNPSYTYLFPLYQAVFSFLYESVGTELEFSDKELIAVIENLFRISHFWKKLVSTNDIHGGLVMMSIKKIEKCVLILMKLFKSVDSSGKIEKLFESVKRSSSIDWTITKSKNKVRLTNQRNFLGAVPRNSRQEYVFSKRLSTLLLNINSTIQHSDNGILHTETRDLVYEICTLLSKMETGQDLMKHNDISFISEIERLENIYGEIVKVERGADNVALQSCGDAKLSWETQACRCRADIVRNSYTRYFIDILIFSEKREFIDHILKICEEATATVSSISAVGILILKQLMSLGFQCRKEKENFKESILNHNVLSLVLALSNEKKFSAQNSDFSRASSLLIKPTQTSSCLKAVYSDYGHTKTSSNNTPLTDISSQSLKIWNERCLPLSEYDLKINMLKSLNSSLWDASFNSLNWSGLSADSGLIYCTSMFLHYLNHTLTSIIDVSSISNALCDTANFDLLGLIIAKISEFPSAFGLQVKLLDSLKATLQKMAQCKQMQPDSKNAWLLEINLAMNPALECVLMMLTKFRACKDNVCIVSRKKSQIILFLYLAMAWIWTSSINYFMSSPQSGADPINYYDFKCANLEHHLRKNENKVAAYSIYISSLTGHQLCLDNEDLCSNKYLHPLIPLYNETANVTRKKLTTVKQLTAYRPNEELFEDLAKICQQTYESFLCSGAVLKMLKSVSLITEQLGNGTYGFKDDEMKILITTFCRVRSNLATFVDVLSQFQAYPDFCIPLQDSVNHFSIGCSLIENAINSCFMLPAETKHRITSENFFSSLLCIQTNSLMVPNIKSMGEDLVKLHITRDTEKNDDCHVSENVLIALLLRLRNVVIFEGSSSSHMQVLKSLMDYIVSEFDEQQRNITMKEEEKASIYKTKHHLEDCDEQHIERDQFHAIFGYNIENKSTDIDTTNFAENTSIIDSRNDDSIAKYSEKLWQVAMQVHKDISMLLGLHCNSSTLVVDVTLPGIFACSKLQSMFESQYHHLLNMGLDDAILNSTLSGVNQCIKAFDEDFCGLGVSCNVYHDPLISEAKCCLPILNSLVSHIESALLSQWPEHPVLITIVEICQRIKNFSVSLPLITFMSGMELLFASVQEWEKNACSSVSLQQYMNDITKLTLKWRKMELSNWSRLINDEYVKLSYVKPSMYFSLYQLIDSQFDATSIKDLITQLENFMESATLPQFCSRLDVLSEFMAHVLLFHASETRIYDCLKNIHSYYSQFKSSVIERLGTLRKPVEKDLKDFVSITKWNDSNFFAVKSSVEKAHKHLFSLVKKFSTAMQEKVKCNVLVQGSNSISFSIPIEIPSVKESVDQAPTVMKDLSVSVPNLSLHSLDYPNLSRISKIERKLKIVCSYECRDGFNTHVNAIEDSIAEIITSAERLREAKPAACDDKGNEEAKAKRIAEAKNIKLRKQKALSDLFKYLSEIGLSFKRGLISNRELTAQEILTTESLKQNSVVITSPMPGKVIVESKSDNQHVRDYFFEIILKWSSLNIAFSVPHQDIPKSSLERCLGFVGSLMSMSVLQRKLLSKTSHSLSQIESCLKTLNIIGNAKCHHNQSRAKAFILDSSRIVNMVCCLLEEFNIWMQSCPSVTEQDCSASCGDHEKYASKTSMENGNPVWSNVSDRLAKLLSEAYDMKCMQDELKQSLSKIYVVDAACILQASKSIESLQLHLEKFITASTSQFQPYSLTNKHLPSMIFRCMELVQVLKSNSREYQDLFVDIPIKTNCSGSYESEILQMSESVVSKLLIGIQEFKKAEARCDSEEFLKFTNDAIDVQIQRLSPEILSSEIFCLVQLIVGKLSTLDTEFMKLVAKSLLVVTREYQALLRQVEIMLEKINRTSMKLCYVICGIFLQLFTNGYCTPEDVKEQVDDGDGAELEDAEGGGVGEGEGTNDVSDQIEDQEMLESKPGEEQDENDQGNIEASENAVEMEKDFEGKFDDDVDDKKDDQSDENDEENVEKQMGELGEATDQDKLDEQFWGSDEESNDEEEDNKDAQTENGPGIEHSEQELAAKDDELDDVNQDDKDTKDDNTDKPNDLSEYNPSEADPYANNDENAEEKEDENMTLPDDINFEQEDLEEEAKDNEDDTTDTVDASDNIEQEEDMQEGHSEVQEQIDDEQDDENFQEENNIDIDAQDPLPLDESLKKDESNTISDVNLENQNQHSDAQDSNKVDQNESKIPPPEKSDENEHSGLAPTSDLDETATQYSRINEETKDPNSKLPSKKQEPKSQDQMDPNNDRDSNIEERLNIVDPVNSGHDENEYADEKRPLEADTYEHVHSPSTTHDKKVFDSADQEVEKMEDDSLLDKAVQDAHIEETMDVDEPDQKDGTGGNEIISQNLSDLRSDFYTNLANMDLTKYTAYSEEDVNKMRRTLEERLQSWRNDMDSVSMVDAENTWESYCHLTRPLAIELCEQLRLVLEPTQASQLKGDYRTGKRLNIRKVIPYIASGFRKDKIWLRRTKPNKRTYQVMLAVDDSSSMIDNHTKQLAYESAAVISGALSSLEVGEFAICSFGEEVELLQNFGETFTTKSGASLLKKCTFSQKKTKIAQFLDYSSALFRTCSNMPSASSDISQLLLIISDGRGLYLEGRQRVLESVNAIHRAGVFVVFVILDQLNPGHGSISDIKVPVFSQSGGMPEIRSYMKDFPFPFYVILRNINVLPQTLGEALRQWFVLVSGSE